MFVIHRRLLFFLSINFSHALFFHERIGINKTHEKLYDEKNNRLRRMRPNIYVHGPWMSAVKPLSTLFVS